MKTIILLVLTFTINLFSVAQDIRVARVDPPFWWTGMKESKLQLLVYGSDISLANPEINYPGVQLFEVIKVENPNYLFLNLNITPEALPGKFSIIFKVGDRLIPPYQYELRARKTGSAERQGFGKNDVIYLLMPDRFSNGDPTNDNVAGMMEKANRSNPDGRHGGDIKGIINHLDYIKELGFTALWCNPLLENDNPEYSYHGYAVTDFYKTDLRFGTNKDYKQLVTDCHNKGLKVIMDFIFNHCSIYSWMIQDLPEETWIHQFEKFTRSNFRASTISDPYASEFDRTRMLTGWFDKHMADLDQRNELLANYLIQNTIWWIEFSEIDGIRIDTQPYPYKEFMTHWGERVFDEYPNFNVVGETWLQKESITSYFQKDAVNKDGYNSNIPVITDFPLQGAITKAFNEKDTWSDGLLRLYYVLTQDFLYAHPENTLTFCDNHDLTRYFSSIKEDINKWKAGITFLLTTRGIPMIYYGTEILMTGEEHQGHGFIREDFPGGWEGDSLNAFTREGRNNLQNEAFNFLKTLLNWRKDKDVIHLGKLKHFVPQDEVYVYFRYSENKCVMVAINNSSKEMKAIKASRYKECLGKYKYAENVLTDETVNYLDAFTLAPKSVMVLELKK
ncbi:MAG: glycoside hydrolase family 13 protein [Bacteroidales bacterium]|nr:glycoside hydrolase family 13 protein [Bacteroidales bacterium]